MRQSGESRYGWVVVGSAFLITFITCGINFSFGVLILPIVNEMGWSRGLVSSVMLVAGGVYCVTLLAVGPLSGRYGYRRLLAASLASMGIGLLLSSQIHQLWQLYIFNGLFIGLSIAASYAIPAAVVALWFTKRQGLALGVATLGVSLGTAFVPPCISWLIGMLGWRTALAIAGVAAMAIGIPAALLIRQPPTVGQQEGADDSEGMDYESEGLMLGEAVRSRAFWMLFGTLLIFLTGLSLIMLHLVPCAIDAELEPVQAAFLLTLVGIAGIAGRLISGVASDRYGPRPVMLCGLALLALITLMLALRQHDWFFYLFAALFGLGYSSVATMMVRMTRYIFGNRALGSIFSVLMVADGIGMGLGPWLAGYIFDLTGGYSLTFMGVAVALALAAVMTGLVRPATARRAAG